MDFLSRFVDKCWTFVLPMGVILVITPPVFFVNPNAAWAVANLGTLGVCLGNIIYIVFFDSRKRWPNLPVFERFKRFITFQR